LGSRAYRHRWHIATFVIGTLFAPAGPALAGDPPKLNRPVSFIKDVAPILKENCFACHDSRKRKGKLDMSTYDSLRKGGESDDPITPGQADASTLFLRITAHNASRMPPKESGDPLSKEKIAVIERWINDGAKLDGGLQPTSDLLREMRIRWKPPLPPAAYRYPVTVNTLAFTPDGRSIVVSGYHELTFWNASSGKLEERLYTRAERTYALAFLADGRLAVAGGRPGQEGDVRIYDVHGRSPQMQRGVAVLDGVNDRGVMIGELAETDDAVLCLALSRDGKKLAAGGCDRLVRVWDLGPGAAHAKLEQSFENHADWVYAVTFSPDGTRLLTASRDKTAKVWDLTAKESTLTFPEHQNIVYDVVAGADGKEAFSVGEDRQVRVWSTTDGKQLRTIPGHGQALFKVLLCPDAVLATCSADTTVRLWNSENGKPVRTLRGFSDWVYALALSPDGKRIAAGAWNGEVRIWNLADGSLLRTFNASPGLQKVAAAPNKPKK
jgi:WD40 repeat protein